MNEFANGRYYHPGNGTGMIEFNHDQLHKEVTGDLEKLQAIAADSGRADEIPAAKVA